jgi:hypothetical protein
MLVFTSDGLSGPFDVIGHALLFESAFHLAAVASQFHNPQIAAIC